MIEKGEKTKHVRYKSRDIYTERGTELLASLTKYVPSQVSLSFLEIMSSKVRSE